MKKELKQKDFLKIIKSLSLQAGDKAAKAWLKYDRRDSLLKGQNEVVTKVDKETEKFLRREIEKAFPEHAILGEEYGNNEKKSDYLWIIDPIDGTTNFSIHNPLWSISIGLAYKNKIIFGLIYAPILKEVFWAERGKGAYLNGKKLKIKNESGGGKEIHTFCHGQKPENIKTAIAYYQEHKLKAMDCRQLGSAAIELAYVAASRVDSIFIPGARSWDVAAGVLIASEAGASVCDAKGKSWSLKSEDMIAVRPKLKNKILSSIKNLKK